MSDTIHALTQQVLQQSSLEACSVDELQSITQRYPYFAPAQFLLLQKLKQEQLPAFETQFKKALLYYNNPLQFNYFISSASFVVTEMDEKVDTEKNLIEEEPQESILEINLPEKDAAEISVTSDGTENDEIDNNSEINEKEDIEIPVETVTEKEERQFIGEIKIEEEPQPAADFLPAEISFAEVLRKKIAEKEMVEKGEDAQPEATLTPPPVKPNQPAEELSFEPFHTVDYFASQGIKISAEELPKDKLGKQLKSFTEWLKTMKRLPATQVAPALQSSTEKNIETMATHSVDESEVVTEAMAEVWAKQGNLEKARETYNKLSLLNPTKNAYFAAKIENLKRS